MMLDHRPPGPDVLVLPEVLDLQQAKPLADALLARRGGDVEVDASGVRRLGGLCLQVLLSAIATWAADERGLAVLSPSPAFLESLDLLGVARRLMSSQENPLCP